jgi:hypothetical protein
MITAGVHKWNIFWSYSCKTKKFSISFMLLKLCKLGGLSWTSSARNVFVLICVSFQIFYFCIIMFFVIWLSFNVPHYLQGWEDILDLLLSIPLSHCPAVTLSIHGLTKQWNVGAFISYRHMSRLRYILCLFYVYFFWL